MPMRTSSRLPQIKLGIPYDLGLKNKNKLHMKAKFILLIIAALMIFSNSLAQSDKKSENRKGIIDYKTELGLTDAQVEQIKTIQKEYLPKLKEARMAGDKVTLKKLNDERKAKIELILTPEQVVKWEAIIEKKKTDNIKPELKRELKDYKKQNIKPVIIEKRTTFENELSAEEKLIIADLRAKREAFLKSAKEQNNEERILRGKELKMEVHKTLKPIIEKHKPTLKKIRLELKPLQIKWEEDMDSIKTKHISDYKSNAHRKGNPKNEMRMIIQFLLMKTEE